MLPHFIFRHLWGKRQGWVVICGAVRPVEFVQVSETTAVPLRKWHSVIAASALTFRDLGCKTKRRSQNWMSCSFCSSVRRCRREHCVQPQRVVEQSQLRRCVVQQTACWIPGRQEVCPASALNPTRGTSARWAKQMPCSRLTPKGNFPFEPNPK